MLSGFNVLDVTLKCLEFSYTMFMCSNGEKVMSFCKVYIHKMAFLLTNPLNFIPSTSKKKKNGWIFRTDIPDLKILKNYANDTHFQFILVLCIDLYNSVINVTRL